MGKRSRPDPQSLDWEQMRERVIGLGERSLRKSYYPELRERLADLERFRNLVNHTHDIILIVDIDAGTIIDGNHSAEMLLGRAFGAGAPMPLSAVAASLGEAPGSLFDDTDQRSRTTEFRRGDGSVLPVELTAASLPSAEERLGVIVARDITERRRVQERLARSEARHRTLVERLSQGLAELDRDGRIAFANPSFLRILGAGAAAPDKPVWELAATKVGRAEIRTRFKALLVGGIDGTMAFGARLLRCDGAGAIDVHFDWSVADEPVGGRAGGVVALVTDVTERNRAEESLRKLSRAVEQSPASVIITDPDGAIEYVNPKFEAISGYRAEEVVGRTPSLLRSPHTPASRFDDMWRTISAGEEWHGELCNRKKDGSLFWEQVSISPITNSAGTVTHYLSVHEDVSERKAYEEQLLRQATMDEVSGLPNRVLAQDRLKQAISRAERHGSMVALLFVDLDHFKRVNDTMGHAAGDALIRTAAQRMGTCLRSEDTVARFGGDEFLVIVPDIGEPRDAELVARKICQHFEAPFRLSQREVFASASVGITLYPADGESAETLLRNADAAMYAAKEGGRNTLRFFTPELNAAIESRMHMESHLRHALDRGELWLSYQPIVDVGRDVIVGAEALMRWTNPVLGAVGPDRFIPLAEEMGLIERLGAWALEQACRQLAAWRAASGQRLQMAVNVSTRQFADGDFADQVHAALTRNALEPAALEVEITESMLLEDVSVAAANLERLAAMGVPLSIDDFGTGYSSLSYLKNFPIGTLKIDRAFVSGVTRDEGDAALTRAIVAMARGLGMSTIAEGIEEPGQLDFLRRNGVERVQGYLFSRPVPPEDFARLLEGQAKKARLRIVRD